MPVMIEADVALLEDALRVHAGLLTHELDLCLDRGKVRVAAEISILVNVMKQRMRVVHAEPAAEVVAFAAELGDAADQLHFAGVGAETEVFAFEVELLAGLLRGD